MCMHALYSCRWIDGFASFVSISCCLVSISAVSVSISIPDAGCAYLNPAGNRLSKAKAVLAMLYEAKPW